MKLHYESLRKCFVSIRLTIILLFFACILFPQLLYGQRPKIGLTLSGGGAKGLAHVGILQAIDSAGLDIEYVTGTSMGSIIGALYAVGYSGDSIYNIVKNLNWQSVLSNKPDLRNVAIEEKEEFGQYALEVSMENGKPKTGTGLIQGEELWLTIAKYLLPAYKVTDFNNLDKSFRCIATNVENGDAVVLNSGNIINSVRASMAIPSVFTAVEINGQTLVDGGLIRNFPVSDAKEMGADIMIGSNVGQPLSKAKDLQTPIDVLYQISFYRDAKDFKIQKSLCDIFVEPDIFAYTAADFAASDSIIEIGRRAGNQLYPQLKALADSLNNIYPLTPKKRLAYTLSDTVKLSKVQWQGISASTNGTFRSRLGLPENQAYSIDQIHNCIRNAYGTTNYNSITYELQPEGDNTNMMLSVDEKSGVYLKAAMHFNTFSGAALILDLTLKNKFLDRSRFMVKGNIGEFPRLKIDYRKYFAPGDKFSIALTGEFDSYDLPLYVDNEIIANHRQLPIYGETTINYYMRTSYLSGGGGIIYNTIKPKDTELISIDGTSQINYLKLRYYLNTTDRHYFATRGWEVNAAALHYFDQRPDYILYFLNDPILDSRKTSFNFSDYQSVYVKSYHYLSLSQKSTLITGHHLGLNVNYKQSFLNEYAIGGLTDFIYHQVPFAGLEHSQKLTDSFGVLMCGWQYRLLSKVYTTLRTNIAVYNFYNAEELKDINADDNFLSGYAATLGVDSPIGPVEFSIQYNDQTRLYSGYVNIGYHF